LASRECFADDLPQLFLGKEKNIGSLRVFGNMSSCTDLKKKKKKVYGPVPYSMNLCLNLLYVFNLPETEWTQFSVDAQQLMLHCGIACHSSGTSYNVIVLRKVGHV